MAEGAFFKIFILITNVNVNLVSQDSSVISKVIFEIGNKNTTYEFNELKYFLQVQSLSKLDFF